MILQTLDTRDDQRFDSDAMSDQPIAVSILTQVSMATPAPVMKQEKAEDVALELQQYLAGVGSTSVEPQPLVCLPGSGGLSRRTPEEGLNTEPNMVRQRARRLWTRLLPGWLLISVVTVVGRSTLSLRHATVRVGTRRKKVQNLQHL